MNIQLSALEARLIGCLIEKALTTPDQYPLSLNALVNACNQKSNRDPVLSLDERSVQVKGEARPFLAGMGGRADVMVGRRSLISYAFEPVRMLRETLSDRPPAKR